MNLTTREKEVLHLIVNEELSSSQIAVRLGLSVGTVDTHRKKLLHKLNVNNSVGLTKKTIQQKIIEVK